VFNVSDFLSQERSRLLAIGLIVIVAAGAGYYAYNTFINPKAVYEEGIYENNTFIDLEIPLTSGETLRISDLKGDVIILNFGSPLCPSCMRQIGEFRQLSGMEGLSIVTVNIDPRFDISFLQELAIQEGITWHYGHLPDAVFEYEVVYIPVVILIDPAGVIRYRASILTPVGILEQLIDQYK
jgi:thiol-disulfide isomerase/thioredoxin